jgi:AraC family transcriptional regulator of adaptative response/methylated-DNA-[protein]-cysteine methyltransferase
LSIVKSTKIIGPKLSKKQVEITHFIRQFWIINITFMILSIEKHHINYQRIEQAIQYLQQNFRVQPELDEVAEKINLSPFHFQRVFSEWAGISPKRFLQYLTAGYLKEKLQVSRNIEEAAEAAGLSSQSRVYDLFTTLEAMTPAEYKQHGSGLQIDYGFHQTPFGNCVIGVTRRGICWLSFMTSDQDGHAGLEEMKTFWYNSIFHQDQALTGSFIDRIFQTDSGKKLHLFLKGTNFQVKVWEALLRIPAGALTTYQDIARKIQSPRAQQAVGSAVGSNIIAYLIPCHRVIRKDGILGEYRWTPERKKSIIGWEMAKNDTPNNH